MPEEPQDSLDFLADPEGNPEEEPEGEPEADEQPEADAAEDGEPAPEDEPVVEDGQPKIDFEGLPYKTGADLVKGYKELQGAYTQSQQLVKEMRTVMAELIQHFRSGPSGGEKPADPEDFKRRLQERPDEVLVELIKKAVKGEIEGVKGELGPLQQQVTRQAAQAEMDKFLGEHPELTDADVGDLLKLMDEYPELMKKEGRLPKFYKLLLAEKPELKGRIAKQKEALEKSATSAKQAASQGGRKATDPKKTQPKGDEFDEVLDTWNKSQEPFKR